MVVNKMVVNKIGKMKVEGLREDFVMWTTSF